jgi:hypothetical protein
MPEVNRHCERSEAIQRDLSIAATFAGVGLDCFAALEMTAREASKEYFP